MKLFPIFIGFAVALTVAGPALSVGFPQADRNGDGVVTYDEARRAFPQLTEVHFLSCDPNKDGVITKNEFPLLNNFYRMNYLDRN